MSVTPEQLAGWRLKSHEAEIGRDAVATHEEMNLDTRNLKSLYFDDYLLITSALPSLLDAVESLQAEQARLEKRIAVVEADNTQLTGRFQSIYRQVCDCDRCGKYVPDLWQEEGR